MSTLSRDCQKKCERCCNSHYELVESMKELLSLVASEHQNVTSGDWEPDVEAECKRAEAALAKATGGAK